MVKATSGKKHEAIVITLNLLSYLAADDELLQRFLTSSGLSQADLKDMAGDENFLASLFDFALSDESLLLAFAAHAGLQPQRMLHIRAQLPGFAE